MRARRGTAETAYRNRIAGRELDPRGTGWERTPEIVERGRVQQEAAKSYDFWVDNGLALIGNPDTVARQLEDQQRRLGYDVFCAQHPIPGMPSTLVDKSLELFAKEVMPAFT